MNENMIHKLQNYFDLESYDSIMKWFDKYGKWKCELQGNYKVYMKYMFVL